MISFLMIASVGGLIVGVIVLAQRAEEKRAEGMRAAGERLGWTYRGSVPFSTIPALDRFELFTQGHGRKLTQLMTSPAGDPRAVLFDYSYSTGGGKSQSTHRQTVIYTASDGLALPAFSLRPQNFFHGIAKAFGYQDIDLEHRPVFSAMFVLRGEDEDSVRSVFNDAVVDYFERHPDACATGVNGEVLFWRAGKRVPPEDLPKLIESGLDLASRFRDTV